MLGTLAARIRFVKGFTASFGISLDPAADLRIKVSGPPRRGVTLGIGARLGRLEFTAALVLGAEAQSHGIAGRAMASSTSFQRASNSASSLS